MRFRTATLLLVASALPGGVASAGDTWVAVAVGPVDPDGVRRAIGVSGDIRFEVGRHFAIQPDIGYWKRTESQLGFSISAEDLSFGLQGLLELELDRVRFHVGAGITVHHITGNIELLGIDALTESLNRVGPDIFAGVELTLSPRLRIFAGARYDWVDLPTDDPDRLDQTRAYAGFRLRL